MSANERIKWFHKKVSSNHYPNSFRIAEKFGISRTQAARDVIFLRDKLKAPILYDKSKKGYYYTHKYKLPNSINISNNDDYISEISSILEMKSDKKIDSSIQIQIPYTATIEIEDKLAILELKDFIKEKIGKNKYACEIKSIELFLCVILTLNTNIRIIEPMWLREKLISLAQKAINNNSDK